MAQSRILVVDDEPEVLSLMRRGLAYAGYSVDAVETGEEALNVALTHHPDAVILDLMLPGIDGLEVCRRLRAGDATLPIMMLTARGRVPDRVAGLDAGADDYLVKPFALDELLARVRALLRRTTVAETSTLRFTDLVLDSATRRVERNGRLVDLTPKEFDLLDYLMRHANQVLSRELIFTRVWGSEFLGDSNLIDVHVMRLREKLEAQGEQRLIHTIRGVGYSLREA